MAGTAEYTAAQLAEARRRAADPAPPVLEWPDGGWRDCVRCPLGRCNVRACDDGVVRCVPVPGTARLRLHTPG